jgi:uncharacterized protein
MKRLMFILPALILFMTSCSVIPLQKARSEYYSGNLAEADRLLTGCKGVPEKDLLLCYMERGLILHYQEAYEESTDVLLKGSEFIKGHDYISVTDQSSAAVINDRVMAYKGEYSERLWVHTFLMMDYLLRNMHEDALVEAKQALELYDKYPDSLADDHFTRGLIALCFENMNLLDDARIEYEKLAQETGKEVYPAVPLPVGKGELVLFIAQGRAPVKVATDLVLPPSIRISVPSYEEGSPPMAVTVRSDDAEIAPVTISTDLGQVSRRSLNDRSAQYIARQAVRAGAKEVIAEEVGNNNGDVAEILARITLFLLEEADTRSWETLPGSLTLVRITLDPGIHDLSIYPEGSQSVHLRGINITDGKRVYRSLRF